MDNFSADPSLQALFAPVLESLEKDRRKIVDRNYNLIMLAFGLLLLGGLLTYDREEPTFIFCALFLSLFSYGIFSDKGAKEWKLKYKKTVVLALVESFFGDTGYYEPYSGHSEAEFMETELFNRSPDRYHSEDLIKGKVDKTLICFSEIHAEYKTTSSKGKTSWHTIFKGILLTADFNKDFKSRTIVKQKGFWNFIKQGNIQLENTAFNKEFSVLAGDSIEARYILSPSMMERILSLNQKWGGAIGICFVRSQVKIAIPQNFDFFEISIWSKIDAQSKWRKDWQIIADMVNIIHDLDLNTRIWTKE